MTKNNDRLTAGIIFALLWLLFSAGPVSAAPMDEVSPEKPAEYMIYQYPEVALLISALEMVTHLGGARGRGAGRCQFVVSSVNVNEEAVTREDLHLALRHLGGDGA